MVKTERDKERDELARAYDKRYEKADNQFAWTMIILAVVALLAGGWLLYHDPGRLLAP